MSHLTRRDVLKLMGALTANGALAGIHPLLESSADGDIQKPNIIILLLDAFSARNMSLYGYERQTTPNFERFASRSTVYHSHYSGGNFTTPGTATLLTGLYPWSHRAITLDAPVERTKAEVNMFNLVGNGFERLGYAQNVFADLLLSQFRSGINEHLPFNAFCDQMMENYISRFFPSDPIAARFSFDDFLIDTDTARNPVPGAAYLGYLEQFHIQSRNHFRAPSDEYPYGKPSNGILVWDNRKVYSGVFQKIKDLDKTDRSYFAYFHLLAPHAEYGPRKEFVGIFPDIKIPFKPRHKLANHYRQSQLNGFRKKYDEYIADVDAEFGKLLDGLESLGVLDNSYFIVTSDHGELFERGESGHNSSLLYDPIIHVPLMISEPGQVARRDFYTRTSSTDVLPTLLELLEKKIPETLEGKLLPGFGGSEEPSRSIFSMEAKTNSAFAPLKRATVAMQKENYKIIYYGDYPRYSNVFELYDVYEDPEELDNLFADGGTTALHLKEELLDTLSMKNRPFVQPG
jgi:arylsulfatase A-like enzyme